MSGQVTLVTIVLNRGASIRRKTYFYAGSFDGSCWREFCPTLLSCGGLRRLFLLMDSAPRLRGTSFARMSMGKPMRAGNLNAIRSNGLVMNEVKERAAREVAEEDYVDVRTARGRLRCGVTLGERSGHTLLHRPRPRYLARPACRSIRRQGRSLVPQRPVGPARRPRWS